MYVFAALIGIFVLAWYWYARGVKREMGEDINYIDAIARTGQRAIPNRKVKLAPIKAIDNPLVAAATLVVSIQSEEFVLGEEDEEVVLELLLGLGSNEDAEAALEYAKMAVLAAPDAGAVIDILGKYFKSRLSETEKQQFIDLVDEAELKIGGCYDFKSSRTHLVRMMGLKISH